MSQQPSESDGNQPPQGHPAWSDLLNEIPEDLRPILEPKFQEFERNYQTKLQGTVEQYKPFEDYKPLVEHNVPMETIQKALWLANQLDQDPQAIVQQAIDTYGLDYIPKSAAVNRNSDEDEDEDDVDFGGLDQDTLKALENHPAFKAIQDQAKKIEEWERQQRESAEQEEAITGMKKQLEELHKQYDAENGMSGFDDLYVTALMAQGVSPEDAVKSYNDTINERAKILAGLASNEKPEENLVVMGGDGSSGSGIPQENVRMGDLGKNDLNNLVLQMIAADQQNQ